MSSHAQDLRFSSSYFGTEFEVAEMVALDANADQRDDLVLIGVNPIRVDVRLSDGASGFTNSQTFDLGSSTSLRVDAADIDSDGDTDLAILSVSSSILYVLLNDGDGTFSTPPGSPIPTVDLTSTVRVADFDLDGTPDLLVGARNSVVVYYGLGGGRFSSAVLLPVSPQIVNNLVVADLRQDDGAVLAVVGSSRTVYFYQRTESGLFQYQTIQLAQDSIAAEAIDTNRSGLKNLVVAHGSRRGISVIRWNTLNKQHVLGPVTTTTEVSAEDAAFGDLNNDGIDDVVYGINGTARFGLFVANTGGSSLYAQPSVLPGAYTNLRQVAVLDSDGDGIMEIAAAGIDRPGVAVFRPQSENDLATTGISLTASRSIRRVHPYTRSDGTKAAYLIEAAANRNVSRVTFPEGSEFFGGLIEELPNNTAFTGTPNDTALGDINGDGFIDIFNIAVVSSVYRVQWLIALDEDNFGLRLNRPTNVAQITSLNVKDVNHDGLDDAIVLDNRGDARVFLALPGGTLDQESSFQMATDTNTLQSLVVDDLDNDGNQDLVCIATVSSSLSRVQIRYGTGDGGFEPAVSFATVRATGSSLPGRLALADLNLDGVLDIVVADSSASYVHFSTGRRNAYRPAETVSSASSLRRVNAFDINGDGLKEIITTFNAYATVTTAGPNGLGSAADSFYVALVDDAVFFDINSDGKEDMLSVDDTIVGLLFNVSAPPCLADFFLDEQLNLFDIAQFISEYGSGTPRADLVQDGALNFFDVAAFMALFNAGCP